MHRLLKRQLKRHGLAEQTIKDLEPFLNAVDSAYQSNDNDVKHLENIIEESSQELFKANQLLAADLDNKNIEITQMNKRYDLVINNISEILFVLDETGVLTYTNHAWNNLVDISIDEAMGKFFHDFKDQFNKKSARVFDKLLVHSLPEVNGILEKGETESTKQWFELKARRIKDIDGNINGTIGIVSDITTIKNTELDLIGAKKSAEDASLAKDEFLSTMSHEIRTPLNAIIGIANILLMQNENEEDKENLSALKYSSDHLLNLINDILDFSKIEAGKIDIDKTDLSLNHFLLGIKSTYQYMAIEKGLEFTVEKDEQIPDLLKGDITRLSQVIGNLISNAIKFTTEGSVLFRLKATEQSERFVSVLFEIIDSGIGIMPTKLEQIFEKFSQASKTTSRHFGGTGLGLPISKKLLELMGSELKVSSTYGKGSTFYFHLNLEKSNENIETIVNNSIIKSSAKKDLGGLRVLVAEDNMLNIMVIKQFLEKWNTKYDIVVNGEEAVDSIKEGQYDLILMDLQMPVMDGYEATRRIRNLDNDKSGIPIIALTASTTIKVKQEAQKVGMNDHIMKPFNPTDLYRTLLSYAKKINSAQTPEVDLR